MGGTGSGRRWSWDKKDTVESCRHIDVRRLQRDGVLKPGYRWNWAWWDYEGNKTSDVSIYSYEDKIRLVYTIDPNTDSAEKIDYCIPISYTDCNYGGSRPWFICPAEGCGRRVAFLYFKDKHFLCRHCHELSYISRQENDYMRLLSKAQKIRVKLGGSGNTSDLFPPKPKHMHRKTYEVLQEKSLNAQYASWDAASKRLGVSILGF